mmetsp:Transcript_62219/g.116435  ORF Transcript_62219/g.116435 Transcript_62219/m.116435 type:complete len:262 (+) Transcript_62219:75-860(+)
MASMLLPSARCNGDVAGGVVRAREAEVKAPPKPKVIPRRSKQLTRWESFKFYLRTSSIIQVCRALFPRRDRRSKASKARSSRTPAREVVEMQQAPQKVAILCAGDCTSKHLKEIEMLSHAHAANGDHIFTSGSQESNAAVIKGALRGGNPEHLTVVLPQTLDQQDTKLRKLIPTCIEAGVQVVSSPDQSSLKFDEAAHLSHQQVLGRVDQLVAFMPGAEEEGLLSEAKEHGVPSTAFYLQEHSDPRRGFKPSGSRRTEQDM